MNKDINSEYNYSRMKESFNLNFKEDKYGFEKYKTAFEYLASVLKNLYIKSIYVDVSKISNNIDFCMNLGKKILAIVGMNAFERDDNDVLYAVYYEGELMVIDTSSVDDFVKTMTNIQNKLWNI